MPSGKFVAGLVLIALAVVLIGLPFTGFISSRSETTTIRAGNVDNDRGYELNIGRGASPLIKVDAAMTQISSGVSRVHLVAYSSYESNAEEVLVGEADVTNGEASLSFTELGPSATPLGLKNPIYYIKDANSASQVTLDGTRIQFAVTPLITTVLIGPIMAIIGIILLFLGRESGYSRRAPRRVSFGDSAPEPVLSSTRPGKGPKKKKKRKRGERPRAKPVGGPKARTTRCSHCGANVPAGQMYCPSCYARV
ncbi:MAG: zinc ribbon domain-containing protein [Candidatus Hodarchaeota archaeon]